MLTSDLKLASSKFQAWKIMDALGLDVMHDEYQQNVEEVREHPTSRPEPSGSSRESSEPPSGSGEVSYEAGVGSSETVPVSDVDEVDLAQVRY